MKTEVAAAKSKPPERETGRALLSLEVGKSPWRNIPGFISADNFLVNHSICQGSPRVAGQMQGIEVIQIGGSALLVFGESTKEHLLRDTEDRRIDVSTRSVPSDAIGPCCGHPMPTTLLWDCASSLYRLFCHGLPPCKQTWEWKSIMFHQRYIYK